MLLYIIRNCRVIRENRIRDSATSRALGLVDSVQDSVTTRTLGLVDSVRDSDTSRALGLVEDDGVRVVDHLGWAPGGQRVLY